ncbi:uracil-DNA glycosylase, family 4 [Gottschalkia purinilytica]|uniref:Type-4 uracil-DNA glycosylase n=1 Tax=Gottschalkia purinilytica TaxID=1503 RepID=A0A0L0W6G3_GOTPU|nr:uracil-DNA glycosylase [Gottschalkia purinilytica]KNF07076.1 uracil-DNA glycosylase, family 4 [Gottschalkia purinilytica]
MKKTKLQELNKTIKDAFKEKDIVLGNGDENSTIILIGEAPGAKEVELKEPFVGQAGKHLTKFLEILKIDRKDLYITNTVKFRPTKDSAKTGKPINRAPSKDEINMFKDYLFDEIHIVNPKVIVTLGNVPLKTVLQNEGATIGELHGKDIEINLQEKEYYLFPLYHPAAVIYKQDLKETYENDLRNLSEFLDKLLTRV